MNWLATLLIAAVVTPTPVQSPEIIWHELDLEQQMAVVDLWRPEPIILPVQRYVPPPRPLEPAWVRTLVETYFQPEHVEWALRVSYCESHWDASAKNPNSSASGLFQHLARFWEGRSAAAGWAGASIWDAEANTAVAAWLYYKPKGGPGHWVCK